MTTNSMGLEQTLSDERLELYANDKRMCNVNDEIREMARELLAYRKASKEPVAYADPKALSGFSNFREHPSGDINIKGREWMWANADSGLLPLFAAPPIQAVTVPDDKQLRALFDAWFASDCSFDCSPDATEEDNIAWRESYWYVWRRCCAAMLKSVTNEP